MDNTSPPFLPHPGGHDSPTTGTPIPTTPWTIPPGGIKWEATPRPIPPTHRSAPMTTPTLPLLPLASDGCGCCAPPTPSATTSAPAAMTDAVPDVSTAYQVTGMTCGHCGASVTEAVNALPQVDEVRIDLAAGGVSTVTVTGAASPETVRRAIEEAGYTVSHL